MIRLLLTCSFFMFAVSVTVCYAANEKPCTVEKIAAKKQACKTSQQLIPEKLLKIKPYSDLKSSEKLIPAPENRAVDAADTFESLIAPLLKAITPHFYDQIIKRDKKVLQAQS